jgi:DNA-binding GntR family transcriptional regulator
MINHKSLREQVYEFLRGELYNGNLAPGSAINLDDFSRRLGVSKTPLRDAFIQLELEGFVTISPRRGFFVNKLSLDAIRHCYEIVGALESAAIIFNFEKIDSNRIAKLKWLNEGLRSAVEREDFGDLYELNLAFHNIFLDLSDNVALRRTVDVTKQRLYDFPRRDYIKAWESGNCDEHQQLIEAFEENNRDRVTEIWMGKHWFFPTQETYIRQFYCLDDSTILCSDDLKSSIQDSGTKALKRKRKKRV